MEVLVLGGSGQVGLELLRAGAEMGVLVSAPPRSELDISNEEAVSAAIASRSWSAVINAAAYTAVDRAESEVAAAWRHNALGPAILAAATRRAGIPLIHVSTDYVFNGSAARPYREGDPLDPINVYGASKAGGEHGVRTANPHHAIVRTAWLASTHRANFVKTILRLAQERPLLRVVDDQQGCPTSASDLARCLLQIATRLPDRAELSGTYHFVNSGAATWYELACEVLKQAGQAQTRVEAITTKDFGAAAPRPRDSRLSVQAVRKAFGVQPRPWRVAIREVVAELIASAPGRRAQLERC